jgi:hypothetical protein
MAIAVERGGQDASGTRHLNRTPQPKSFAADHEAIRFGRSQRSVCPTIQQIKDRSHNLYDQ